jgi:hypothetical protein
LGRGWAAKALAAREQWIGWDARTRLSNLARVVNNSRFLLLRLDLLGGC